MDEMNEQLASVRKDTQCLQNDFKQNFLPISVYTASLHIQGSEQTVLGPHGSEDEVSLENNLPGFLCQAGVP